MGQPERRQLPRATMAHMEAYRAALDRNGGLYNLKDLQQLTEDAMARLSAQGVPLSGPEWLAAIEADAVWTAGFQRDLGRALTGSERISPEPISSAKPWPSWVVLSVAALLISATLGVVTGTLVWLAFR